MSNPLVAPVKETSAVAGVPLLEDATGLKEAIESKNWAAVAIGAVGTAIDVLTAVMDPFGAIFAAGVGWLMEHVGPLKEALDALTGNADQISSQAQTWTNVAKELEGVSAELGELVKKDLESWQGDAADSYRKRAEDTSALIASAQKGSEGAASGVKTAGEVVAAVRSLVRDTIADLVGHLISWALQVLLTAGIGMAWVGPQVAAAAAKTASRITQITTKLVKALKALIPLLKKAGTLFEDAGKALKGLKGGKNAPAPKPKDINVKSEGGGTRSHPGGDDSTHTSGAGGGGGHQGSTGNTHTSGSEGGGQGGGHEGGQGGGGSHESGGNEVHPSSTQQPRGNQSQNPAEHHTDPNEIKGCGDPIDVATGAVYLVQEDLNLPGVLPLTVERTHRSTYRSGGFFGPTWSSTLDERLEVGDDGLHYAAPNGVLVRFPFPQGIEAVATDDGPYLALRRVTTGFIVGDPQSSVIRHFTGEPGDRVLRLHALADSSGNRIDFRYEDGVPVAMEHSGGYRVTVESADGLVTALRVPDAPVAVREYRYDSARRLTEVVDAVGTSHKFRYDADGRMVRWDDVNGRWYSYHYDSDGRCVRAQGDGGYLDTELSYENLVTTVTDSLGAVTRYQLNEQLKVVAETDPLGNTSTTEYDEFGRVVARTDALGHVTRWEFDEVGNVAAVTRPDGSRLVNEYDERGLRVSTTGPAGDVWRYEYDEQGSLVKETDPAGGVTAYTYHPDTGAIATRTDALGGITRFESDAAGLPTKITAPDGAVTRYSYDALGAITSITGPTGASVERVRDAAGNLVQQRNADGTVSKFGFKAAGNVEESVDPRGGVHRVEYGAFGLPLSAQDPDGGVRRFGYDTELRLTTVTNERGLVWRYEYDQAGRVVAETDYNGRVLRYGYDAAGRLVRRVNAAGQAIDIEYDALGRLVRRTAADDVAEFAYDHDGRMVLARNGETEVRFEYDALGQLVSESINGRVVRSEFDALGRRVGRRTPTGAESSFGYDSADRPTAVTTAGRTLRFEYDAAGQETVRRLFAGTAPVAELRQDWTSTGRLRGQTVLRGAATVQQRDYRYLPDGNLYTTGDLLSGPRAFEVGAGGRVTAVRGPKWQESYRYDAAGAVAEAGWPGDPAAAGPRTYRGTLIESAGETRYTHDAEGRVVTRECRGQRWEYQWNSASRLTGVRTPDGTVWRYRYDALGRRVAKQRLDPAGAVAEQIEFAWDHYRPAEQVHSAPGRPQVATVWDWLPDSDRVLAQTERKLGERVDERFHAIVTDLVGAPAELVDSAGALAGHQRTSLWGAVVSEGGNARTPLRFPGQYYDPETGLHYNMHRYYDPETGRYLSHDPLGLTPSPDSQAYVDNPTAMIDPLGLNPLPTGPCPKKLKEMEEQQAGNKRKRDDDATPDAPPAKKASTEPSNPPGTYGDRNPEAARVGKNHGYQFDGHRTNQHEHVGVHQAAADNGSGLPRKRSDETDLEHAAYSYTETHDLHRKHPGTGSGNRMHTSGFTSGKAHDEHQLSYAYAQRRAYERKDTSDLLQLNQMGYAHMDGKYTRPTYQVPGRQPHNTYLSPQEKVYHGDDPNHVHHPDFHDPKHGIHTYGNKTKPVPGEHYPDGSEVRHRIENTDKQREDSAAAYKQRAEDAKAEQERRDYLTEHRSEIENGNDAKLKKDLSDFDEEQKYLRGSKDSYQHMVDEMYGTGKGMPYNPAPGTKEYDDMVKNGESFARTDPLTAGGRAEAHLAYEQRQTGQYPQGTADELLDKWGFQAPKDKNDPTWQRWQNGDYDPPELRKYDGETPISAEKRAEMKEMEERAIAQRMRTLDLDRSEGRS
ncbi:RHS repeat-associated core domain-containing protein [Amycolatopsis sp. A1MSW2902]|uniref:RHS repeat-associated core domain-containing protein n=1 Tax=Amycolatopsis sp. A1MSW2902 TaxID=687413 RepID=UPI00307CE77F